MVFILVLKEQYVITCDLIEAYFLPPTLRKHRKEDVIACSGPRHE